MREIAVSGGSAHPALTAEICAFLSVPQQPVRLIRFANDCLAVQLQANCRERDVFIIQPLVPPVQENLVELLLMADAARGASAARVTAVMSRYAYARSDKKDEPRISIGGRLVADLLVTAGVNRVLTLTLHSPQVHGFFSVPADHLHALRELAAHFGGRDLSRAVVVSPDLGYAKSAAAFARRLGVPVAAGAKQRISDLKVIISAIIGDVAGRDVIILDDEIARGTTVFELLTLLREQDVRSVAVACTHGLFANGALDKLAACDVAEIVCTNSVPVPPRTSRSCTCCRWLRRWPRPSTGSTTANRSAPCSTTSRPARRQLTPVRRRAGLDDPCQDGIERDDDRRSGLLLALADMNACWRRGAATSGVPATVPGETPPKGTRP